MPGHGISNSPFLTTRYGGGGGYTPSAEALAWETRIIANGGSIDPAVLQAIDENFIIPNVAGGNWAKLDRLNFWLTNSNEIAACTTMVGNYLAEFVNPVVFDDSGIKSNGTNAYVRLIYNPSANGVNYTLNSCSLGYVVEDPTFTVVVRSLGCLDVTATQRAEVYGFDGVAAATSFVNATNAVRNFKTPTGNVIIYGKRVADAANSITGVNATETSGATVSTAIPNFESYELTTNYNNTPLGDYDTHYHHLSFHGAPDLDFALIQSTVNATEIALAAL